MSKRESLAVLLVFFLLPFAFAEEKSFTGHELANKGASLEMAQWHFQKLLARESARGVLPINQSKIYLHPNVTARSALVIAGLFDTPRFMHSLSKTLFGQGMNVLALNLSGHGTGQARDLQQVRYIEWIDDLKRGLNMARLMGEKVTIMGHSTGGALGAIAACNFNTEVDSLILLAPALDLTTQTSVAMNISARLSLNSSVVCPSPETGGAGCTVMNIANSLFQSQLREGLPVAPAAGLQVSELAQYARFSCGEDYKRITQPVFISSTENDDVINHNLNVRVSQANGWRSLFFTKRTHVNHVNLPKSAEEEFAKDPRSHNRHFDSLRGHIVVFISELDLPRSALPER